MNARSLFERGCELAQQGRLDAAREQFNKALRLDRSSAAILTAIGDLEVEAGRFEHARRARVRAYDLSRTPELAARLAWAYFHEQRWDDIDRVLDGAIAAAPRSHLLLGTKSQFFFFRGRHADAVETIRSVLDDTPEDPELPIALAHVAHKAGLADRAVEMLNHAIANPTFEPGARINMRFRLANLLDAMGRYDDAWAAAEAANRQMNTGFDPDRFAADVDRIIDAWTPERVAACHTPRSESDRPVFVVGLPRSGSTLAEQILCSHPCVCAGGELGVVPDLAAPLGHPADAAPTRASVERLSSKLVRAYRAIDPDAARVTDKTLDNTLHLGLIAQLLPRARVIHCIRDPLDTAVSCYLHIFGGAVPFAYDLRHLGLYARHTERLMDHWKRVLPLRFFDLRYDRLIADQQRTTRDLLAFLDLDFDDACLRFHESGRVAKTASIDQVRRPLFTTSLARHTHYDAHLGPLRAALGL